MQYAKYRRRTHPLSRDLTTVKAFLVRTSAERNSAERANVQLSHLQSRCHKLESTIAHNRLVSTNRATRADASMDPRRRRAGIIEPRIASIDIVDEQTEPSDFPVRFGWDRPSYLPSVQASRCAVTLQALVAVHALQLLHGHHARHARPIQASRQPKRLLALHARRLGDASPQCRLLQAHCSPSALVRVLQVSVQGPRPQGKLLAVTLISPCRNVNFSDFLPCKLLRNRKSYDMHFNGR